MSGTRTIQITLSDLEAEIIKHHLMLMVDEMSPTDDMELQNHIATAMDLVNRIDRETDTEPTYEWARMFEITSR